VTGNPGIPASRTPIDVRAFWTLALMTLSLIVSFIDRQALNLVVDPVRSEIGITDVQIGLLQGGAFAIFFTVVGLPIGRAVDVYSRKWIVIGGVLVWSIATVFSGLARSFEGIFLARMFMGIGEATLLPAGTSLIADVFPPERRATAIAVFFLGTAVGSAIANVTGGVLLGVIQAGGFHWFQPVRLLSSWRVLFCLISLPGFLLTLLLLTLREPKRLSHLGSRGGASLKIVIRGLLERRAILVPLYICLGFTALWSLAVVSWTPTLLSRVYGQSSIVLGTALGVAGLVGGVIGVLASGPFGDLMARRYGIRGRLVATTIASFLGIPIALLGLSHSPQTIAIMFGMMCTTTSAAGALAATSIQDAVTSEMRGVATALISVFTTVLGLSLGPWLVGFLTEHVFGNPLSLGLAISSVALPGSIAASVALLPAVRHAILFKRQDQVPSEVA
jgi:MFS family permease